MNNWTTKLLSPWCSFSSSFEYNITAAWALSISWATFCIFCARANVPQHLGLETNALPRHNSGPQTQSIACMSMPTYSCHRAKILAGHYISVLKVLCPCTVPWWIRRIATFTCVPFLLSLSFLYGCTMYCTSTLSISVINMQKGKKTVLVPCQTAW